MRSTAQLRNVYDPAFMRKVKRTLNAYKESMGESKTKGLSREAFVDVDSKGAAWYLGHMRSTATELQEKVKDADFILEIRDARLPFTTANPNIKQLTRKKPSLLIFNKAELANEDCNRAAQDYFERHGQFTIFTSARRSWRDIVEAVQRFCTHILPQPAFRCTAHVGLVVGMPNVGKSTLINALRLAHEHQFHREDFRRSRTPEQVSITPGTTRGLKLVPLSKDPNIVLYDSPGLTLPGCFAKEAGLKLAACGIIPTNNLTLPNSTVARYIYDIMVASSSTEHLAECLRLPRAPISFDDCMAMMCERSGSAGLTELGNVDPRRAHRFLLHDFQMGNLGKLTLDPLPRHMLKATHDHPQLEPNLSDRGSSSTSSTGEEEVMGEEDFTWTHHVETADVVDRAPEHMRGVLEALKGSPAHTAAATHRTRRPPANTGVREGSEGVISRKRGPISRVAPQSALRFAPGR